MEITSEATTQAIKFNETYASGLMPRPSYEGKAKALLEKRIRAAVIALVAPNPTRVVGNANMRVIQWMLITKLL